MGRIHIAQHTTSATNRSLCDDRQLRARPRRESHELAADSARPDERQDDGLVERSASVVRQMDVMMSCNPYECIFHERKEDDGLQRLCEQLARARLTALEAHVHALDTKFHEFYDETSTF